MTITAEIVPWIIGCAVALFAFGYGVGHALGKRDGEEKIAEYYDGKRRRT